MESRQIYQLLTKYRFTLYGIALVWIFFRHTFFYNQFTYGYFDPLVQIGDCGVDIFMFLSGFGLYFSFEKNPSIKEFYKKRVIRIIPSVVVLLAIFAIGGDIMRQDSVHTILSPKYWILSIYSMYWFIGAILLFYLCYPAIHLYLLKCSVWKIVLIAFAISLFGIFAVHFSHLGLLGQLEVYFARIPVFVFGAMFAKHQRLFDNRKQLLILFLLSLPLLYVLPKALQRMTYVFLALAFVTFVPYILAKIPSWINKSLAYIGKASLEFYLIHIFLFSQGLLAFLVDRMNQGLVVITALCTVMCCSIVANLFFVKLNKFLK